MAAEAPSAAAEAAHESPLKLDLSVSVETPMRRSMRRDDSDQNLQSLTLIATLVAHFSD